MPIATAVPLALLFCLMLSPAAAGAVHEKLASPSADPLADWRCESCHTSDPSGEPQVFAADPVNALCLACHPEVENRAAAGKDLSFSPVRNAHPVLTAGSGTTIPGGFWLDHEGRLNCATCHDPHPETARDKLLRGNQDGTAFCRECHGGSDHGSGAFVAHARARSDNDGSPDDELDLLSADCTICHNGSTAMEASFCLLGQQGQCAGHIVGLDYAAAAAANAGLNRELDPRISLHQGKIGCTSCHSIYSSEPTLLVISNQGSTLCLACHRK